MRILVSPWLLTWWANYCLYLSSITLHLTTFLRQAFCDRWPLSLHYFAVSKMNFKKSCLLCRNFISIYKINRTLHGHLGIRILSSRVESVSHSFASLTRERYFQHSKIKFVSPRGHVISSICISQLFILCPVAWIIRCHSFSFGSITIAHAFL